VCNLDLVAHRGMVTCPFEIVGEVTSDVGNARQHLNMQGMMLILVWCRFDFYRYTIHVSLSVSVRTSSLSVETDHNKCQFHPTFLSTIGQHVEIFLSIYHISEFIAV
jgi:hypothetical protein